MSLDSSPKLECIPALVVLSLSVDTDEELKQLAKRLIMQIAQSSDFTGEVPIIEHESVSRDGSEQQTRRLVKKPKQGESEVTVKTIVFVVHMFVTLAIRFEDQVLRDALDAFVEIVEFQIVQMSTRMLLDIASFSLMLFADEEQIGTKARALLDRVHAIAEENNDVDVLVTTNSIRALFYDT